MPETTVAGEQRSRFGDLAPDSVAPRLATIMAIVVLCGYLVVQFLNIMDLKPSSGRLAISILCVLAIFLVQLLHCSRTMRSTRLRQLAWVTLPVQALLSYLPLYDFGLAWGGVSGFLLASILLLVRPPVASWTAYTTILVITGVVGALRHLDADDTAYLVIANGLTGLVIYAITRLADLVSDVHAARRDLARLAVEEERNRFSRDLHDLLGYSLSAITLKSELAYRLVEMDPAQAKQDIATTLSIARQALSDVRSVARSYRDLSLSVQATSAKSMLETAGIAVHLDVGDDHLPAVLDTVLATIVREGVTNLLRHSKAENCRIELTVRDKRAHLVVANDGIDDTTAAEHGRTMFGDDRGGLENLRTRVEAIGGTLIASIDETGWFQLAACAPLQGARRAHGAVNGN